MRGVAPRGTSQADTPNRINDGVRGAIRFAQGSPRSIGVRSRSVKSCGRRITLTNAAHRYGLEQLRTFHKPIDFGKNKGTVMGGYCSGRVGYRAKCESLLAIDVRRWKREACLSRPYFGWHWVSNGQRTSSIGVWGYGDRVELDYNKDGKKYRYPIFLASTRCNLGGHRTWFQCPTAGCGRRTAKLYLGNRYFACRTCYGLAYQSQSYSRYDRALTQAGKIRKRLGGCEGIAWSFPDKPKRMRWRTYERLRERCEGYEAIADGRLWEVFGRLLSR
jgi:hypothetical protein